MSHPDSADDKGQALRRTGTLNPKAHRLGDELFAEHAFFDARDLVQVKYEMLRRVEHDGWSVSRSAKRFGFSRPTYYQTRDAFKEKGLWGLLPQRRGPKGARKLTREMVKVLEALRMSDPSLSWTALTEELEQRFGLRVHTRTIKRRLTGGQKKR